tara:strand:- start:611 stop:1048 length:438 start_codon:yes stop_codon:yes gene_type:complete
MFKALALASKAGEAGEVPVGALLVKDNICIGEGWNCPISTCDPTAHAEIVTLRNAAANLNNYRLSGTTLYATIEPCTMCIGAMIHARVARLVYGATEPRAGAVVSRLELAALAHYNHKLDVVGGVLAEQCGDLISTFFRNKRSKK